MLITWNVDDTKDTLDELDNLVAVNRLRINLAKEEFDTDGILTSDAIALIKHSTMGEYHAVLIRHEEELLMDSELYFLTWDGEASDGGSMERVDWLLIKRISEGRIEEND